MNFSFKNYLSASCLILAILGLNACVKDRNTGYTEFSNLAPTVSIVEGGLGKFSSQTLLFPSSDISDTISFRINYSATTVAPRDITVTLAYDAAAIVSYNASDPTNPNYVKFPDSIYAAFPTKVVIRKGQSYSDPVKLVVYPNKIDPSINYMLPISIADAEGIIIASNFRTIYYHLIGNPLAGAYNIVGIRYNYNASPGGVSYSGPASATDPNIPAGYTGTVNLGTSAVPVVKAGAPIDSKTISMDFANLGAGVLDYAYLITGVSNFSMITVDYNTTFFKTDALKRTYIMSYTPPSPGVKPAFRIVTHYNNNATGTGNDRIIDESFTHK